MGYPFLEQRLPSKKFTVSHHGENTEEWVAIDVRRIGVISFE
jgi:hypothetical protein